ncbi:hypothetical protein AVEN_223595-1 [Araneus ventricosus]|uniref:Helitron helicase-like domain-containing protein n=1 Tax=Araneus ventricosus TaxID=182803 RepID=A0A4Y2HJT6_ARAVE|nr:hypothetical protein AVEN_223595-1 [Araneus ventricosus]
MRIVDGIRSSFRCVRNMENVPRKEIEDPAFINECVEKNFAFLKSLPISVAYWLHRKSELFAMIRQLGKPTAFLTMSANEIRCPHLLVILHRLNHYYKDIIDLDESNIFEKLNSSMRSALVNEDPFTCCVNLKNWLIVLIISINTIVFQRNKREFRVTSRNKRELTVTSRNKRV